MVVLIMHSKVYVQCHCGTVWDNQLQEQMEDLVNRVPNLLDDRVVDGDDETQNTLVRSVSQSVSQWSLIVCGT